MVEEFFTKTSDQITSRLKTDKVRFQLWSRGIITVDDYNEIGDLSTPGPANRISLIKVLSKKGEHVVPEFIEIVEKYTVAQNGLVQHLKDVAAKLVPPQQLRDARPIPMEMGDPGSTIPPAAAQQVNPRETVPNGGEPIFSSMVYQLNSTRKGHVLIINNISFQNDYTGELERRGAAKDTERLSQLFTSTQFAMNVVPERDLRANDFHTVIRKFKDLFEYEPADVCVVVIMSHGLDQDRIVTTDRRLLHINADILHQFNNSNFPAMINKPKIFFFQCCRGDPSDHGVTVVQRDSGSAVLRELRIPSWTDMLVCYSTMDGYCSFRNTVTGTWFIELICEVFYEYASSLEICKMLNIVAERMKAKETACGEKQICPYLNIGFTKEFRFVS